MDWYYAEAGQQRGPVTEAEFNGLVQAGTIREETLIWRDGMANWQTYGQVKAGVGAAPASGPVPEDAVVCSSCNGMFGRDEVIKLGESWVCASCKPAFVQRLKEGANVSGALDYAGFWIRFVAKFIDNLILMLVIVVPIVILFFVFAAGSGSVAHVDPGNVLLGASGTAGGEAVANAIGVLAQAVFFLVSIGYSTFFVGKYGATPGKMACKLKVVDVDGNKIGYGRAFGRACAEILSGLICNIGYIMAAFDGQKRALHDHICSTRVVHNRSR